MPNNFRPISSVDLPATVAWAVPYAATGDFDADGRTDLALVTGHPATAVPAIWNGSQSGDLTILSFETGGAVDVTSRVIRGTEPQIVGTTEVFARDYNGDGHLDLFLSDSGVDFEPFPGGRQLLLLSDGSGRLEVGTPLGPATFAHSAATGDIDGDGRLDVFVGGNSTSGPFFLMNRGDGQMETDFDRLPTVIRDVDFMEGFQYSFDGSRLADLDADADLDLVLLPKFTNAVPIVLENPGNGDFSAAAPITLPAGLYGAGSLTFTPTAIARGTQNWTEDLTDLNRDGLPDLILAQSLWDDALDAKYRGGRLQILINEGSGIFSDETDVRLSGDALPDEDFTNFFEPKVVDLDGDGHLDLVVTVISQSANYTSRVYLNDGTGRLVQDRAFDTRGIYFPLDATGDGRVDLVHLDLEIIGADGDGFGIAVPRFTILENLVGSLRFAGGPGRDVLQGTSGSDTLAGGAGDDEIHGGAGIDTAVFEGAARDFRISGRDAEVSVSGPSGIDTLFGVERLRFADGLLAVDLAGNAGRAYRIYQAAFDRTPDLAGLSFWVDRMDEGMALLDVANMFLASDEAKNVYGADPAVRDFVDRLYQNVLGRPGDPDGVSFWTAQLETSATGHGEVLVGFSESAENIDLVAPTIENGIWLEMFG
ncbi:FG-GAP-like repeat-containing protein [Salinarimonas ramus]|uniref:DUF4214 domain-containing protein n=1 Tax=Salinarimonas ramus TaxID=690164 RepID=A0A917V7F1_9HYPH|nr:FG-GAP-like repeat-containing protein [Salinarimonas ramus]GGK47287.1 hypothetical protein GCM10011322_37970 [Salinarimonas ramus]